MRRGRRSARLHTLIVGMLGATLVVGTSPRTAAALRPEQMAPTRLRGELGRRAELVRSLLVAGRVALPGAVAGDPEATVVLTPPETAAVPAAGLAPVLQVFVRHGLLEEARPVLAVATGAATTPPEAGAPTDATAAPGAQRRRDPSLDTPAGLAARLGRALGCDLLPRLPAGPSPVSATHVGCWIDAMVWAQHTLVDGAGLGARSQPLPPQLKRPTERQRNARARDTLARRVRALRQVAQLIAKPDNPADQLAGWLRELGVGDWPPYVGLVAGLARYRQLATLPMPPLPADFPVAAKLAWRDSKLRRAWKRKLTDVHRAALRERLCFEGYCVQPPPPPRPTVAEPAPQPPGGTRRKRASGRATKSRSQRRRRPFGLQSDLREQLRAYQRDRGLLDRGLTDAATLAALRTPMASRVMELRLNLQRMRDSAIGHPTHHFVANIPAFRLDVWQDGAVVRSHKIQVGKGWRRRARRWVPGHRTPLLTDRLRFVVLNPEWVVPSSIRREYRWKIKRDPDYLRKHGFEMRVSPGGATTLVMKAGGGNLLGRVKFLFPNPYLVYLHDTPTQWAFHKTRRTMSHGCVRVQHAQDLARYLLSLGRTRRYTNRSWDKLMKRVTNKWKPIRAEVTIQLVYWTADVAAGGRVRFYPDVYRLNGADFRAWREADLRRLTPPTAPVLAPAG